MKRPRLLAGWLIALGASAVLPIMATAAKIRENPLGHYVDDEGRYTAAVAVHFVLSWLPIGLGVSALALACLFLDRRER